ncbi:transposase [Klebsiella aerogenes]|uniref:transposase n=1 Tax=Klebsiella aerogenes TaxID=548 RepID=UPI0009D69AC2|nr:transposase [Klebsiella aerogenes]EIV6184819.1 transposase [Klebsiella aerogenes]
MPGYGHLRDEKQWRRYLDAQYGRYWKAHFAKKTRGAWRSFKYLGRYLKRPPVSAAKLRRYISHVTAKHFKMVRYYGFCPTENGVSCCKKSMTPCRWKRGKSRSSRASPR